MVSGGGRGRRILELCMHLREGGEVNPERTENHRSSLRFCLAPITTCTCVLLPNQHNNTISFISPNALDGADTIPKGTQMNSSAQNHLAGEERSKNQVQMCGGSPGLVVSQAIQQLCMVKSMHTGRVT